MPKVAPKPCKHPGCKALVRDGSSRCEAHKVRDGTFADRNRGTRQQRGYGAAWERLRLVVLRRDAGLCQPCLSAGRITLAVAVDHIKNKASGGTDDLTNLRAICKDCHDAKTAAERAAARGVGQKSAASAARTDRLVGFFTGAKTTPLGVKRLRGWVR